MNARIFLFHQVRVILPLLFFTFFPLVSHSAKWTLACAVPNRPGKTFQTWAYLPVTNPSQVNPAHLAHFDIISAGGFYLSRAGLHIHPYALRYPLHKKAKLIPLITFTSVNEGKKFLSQNRFWQQSLTSFRSLIHKGMNHLHFDIEYFPATYLENLVSFFQFLKAKLPGISISMALFPPVDFPPSLNDFHNPKILRQVLDKIVLMAYDYHRPGTIPGPVTDIRWAEKNIFFLMKFFSPERIYLGMPAYGYAWENGKKTKVISMRQLKNQRNKFTGKRDASLLMCGKYGHSHLCIPDRTTIDAFSDLVQKYRLQGLAVWNFNYLYY